MTTPRTPAAVYVRKSTRDDDRQVQSLGDQERAIRAWAEGRPFDIVTLYRDSDTGTTAERPGLVQLMADAAAGKFRTVLVYDAARWFRDQNLAAVYEHRLNEQGVGLVQINAPDGLAGRTFVGVDRVVADLYAVNLSRQAVRGMLSRVTGGSRLGNRPPFGYDLGIFDAQETLLERRVYAEWLDERGRLRSRLVEPAQPLDVRRIPGAVRRLIPSADPAKVATLRRVFELRTQGIGYRTIAQTLNAEHRPAPTGNGWGCSSVYHVLSNPVYIGTLVWGSSASGKYHGVSGGKQVERGDAERLTRRGFDAGLREGHGVRVEDAHEALIPRRVWDTVRSLRGRMGPRHGGKGARSDYRFSGLVRCTCGYGWGGTRRVVKGKVYRYFRCIGYHHRGRTFCSAPVLPMGPVEDTLLADVAAFLEERIEALTAAPEFRTGLEEGVRQAVGEPRRTGKRVDYAKEIARLQTRIGDDPGEDAKLSLRVRTLKAQQREAVGAQVTALPRLDVARLVREAHAQLTGLRQALQRGSVPAVKAVLRELVDEIVLDAERGEFVARYRELVDAAGRPILTRSA